MLGALKKIKEAWGWAKTVWEVLGWLGFTAAITGVAASIGGAVWAVIIGVPLPIAIMAGYCTFVGAVYLVIAPMLFRALGLGATRSAGSIAAIKTPPDYNAWRQLKLIRLSQAAYLWCERDPNIESDDPEIQTWLEVFKDAIKHGDLRLNLNWADSDDLRHAIMFPDDNHTVARSDLQAFAKKRGYDKRFLRDSD
jgi:hypothetical protein